MTQRSFPVVFARRPRVLADFYRLLGFEQHFQSPPDVEEPGYIGLRRDGGEIAVVSQGWPTEQYGLAVGADVRFEMFVYVDDVDLALRLIQEADAAVLRPAADMPWGERIAYVSDPEGNPVAIASTTQLPG